MVTLEKALEIAARAHAGQKDKEGLPYILHPLGVTDRAGSPDARIVAVLHDVVEDTAVTLDDLRADAALGDVLQAPGGPARRGRVPVLGGIAGRAS